MQLYNTLTRQVEDFIPQNPPKVTFYSCGPTVYDYPHIGNWYAFIRWDIVSRTLQANSYDTDWVMNITDVGHLVSDNDEGEDKLEKGAKREGKTAWEVAKFYTDYFLNGLERLNVNQPAQLPKATDHIQEQISLITELELKGFTYTITDGVYFDTSKLADYGKLARLDIKHLQAGARVEMNPEKHSPTDFALWKFSPKDEKRDMEWDSPFGKGFPGWHIECSAMSMKYLGETLDIHAGGIDHIPVHHTNEIAQSEAATGKAFTKYWLHSNFILVNGKKMSKSNGSFITLENIEEHGFDLMAFRLMVLQSHYRTEAHFSWENLEAAQNRLNELRAWADLRHQPTIENMPEELDNLWKETLDTMVSELSHDFNTPGALSALAKLVSYMEECEIPRNNGKNTGSALAMIDMLLGLGLDNNPDISDSQKDILSERQTARDSKDWQKSDELRDTLKSQGITIKDTPRGQVWARIFNS